MKYDIDDIAARVENKKSNFKYNKYFRGCKLCFFVLECIR